MSNSASWICEQSGKKCYRLCARELQIAWIDDSRYWKWTSLPESRFSEAAELIRVCWFNIIGKMQHKMLSPLTYYTSYLVFKLTNEHEGLDRPITASIKFVVNGLEEIDVKSSTVYLVPTDGRVPQTRSDGWMEIEIGTFFRVEIEIYEDIEIIMRIMEVHGFWKEGLIVGGIEVRPKDEDSD